MCEHIEKFLELGKKTRTFVIGHLIEVVEELHQPRRGFLSSLDIKPSPWYLLEQPVSSSTNFC